MLLINGRYGHCIEAADRGFQYGDGVFTTLPVLAGHPIFLPLHLMRLAGDCGRLGIPFPTDSVLEPEVRQLCRVKSHGVLKIQITRGAGPRGYRPTADTQPTRVLSLQEHVSHSCQASEQGVRVRLCRSRLGVNPALAGIKHMNRLEQILARSEWDDALIREGLMLDNAGALIEGTMSNVFLVVGGRLVTPDLSGCGVAGVMRSVVLALAAAEGIGTEVRRVAVDELGAASEVFLTNSLIRIWPVVALDNLAWTVGPVTQRLHRQLEARIRAETGGTV
ncbi:aminodeoxychorismate lyase [Methylolobus aquaticus]